MFEAHDFECDTTEHFGGDEWNPPGVASRYFCHGCCVFVHYYHHRPNIYEAMAVAGVPEACKRDSERSTSIIPKEGTDVRS